MKMFATAGLKRPSWFRRVRRLRGMRLPHLDVSQMPGTYLTHGLHVPVSLRRLAYRERAAAATPSSHRMLLFNMAMFNSPQCARLSPARRSNRRP